mgnify:CR=1 FL=1
MSSLLEDKVKEQSNTFSISLLLKILVIVLSLTVLVLSLLLVNAMGQEETIVALKPDNTPVPTEIKENKISYLVDYEKFLHIFLNQLYDWNYQNYVDNIKGAIPLMSSSLKKQYLNEIKEGGYIEQVNDYQITSSLTIQKIKTDSIKKYKGGYKVKVQALKLKVRDFIDRSIPVEIVIAFRPTDISKNNVWGLEVFEIKERNL